MPTAAFSLPELDRVLQHGSPEKCARMLTGITNLFLSGASRFNDDHIELFDAVFAQLIEDIETRARAELSHRLAPISNAPPRLVLRLAGDDDISVAAPMLEQSRRLNDVDLRQIAATKGQPHLLAMAGRKGIGEAVTDLLVQRGGREVVHSLAGNQSAQFSARGFSELVARAAGDGTLTEKVGQRSDIPPPLFRVLLIQATEVVQQRLLAKASPETAAEIRRVLAKLSDEIGATAPQPRNYVQAKASVSALKEQGKAKEAVLVEFAQAGKFEETVVALAELTSVPIETVERLMGGDRPDPVLILCKSAGLGWQTVRAIIMIRPGAKPTSAQVLHDAHANFERLSSATAQRVRRFWQIRQYGQAPEANANGVTKLDPSITAQIF